MQKNYRRLRRNLRGKLASTFDSEFALELGASLDHEKDFSQRNKR